MSRPLTFNISINAMINLTHNTSWHCCEYYGFTVCVCVGGPILTYLDLVPPVPSGRRIVSIWQDRWQSLSLASLQSSLQLYLRLVSQYTGPQVGAKIGYNCLI